MTDTNLPPTAPPLTGQDMNLAASATRRALRAALVPLGITFEQWTIINQVGSGQVTDEAGLTAALTNGLQLTDAEVRDLLASVVRAGLVDQSGALTLTSTGRDLFDEGAAIIAGLVAELYVGFAPEDLARTRSILVEVTARAEARLAATA